MAAFEQRQTEVPPRLQLHTSHLFDAIWFWENQECNGRVQEIRHLYNEAGRFRYSWCNSSLWAGHQAHQQETEDKQEQELLSLRVHPKPTPHKRTQIWFANLRFGHQLWPSENIRLQRGALPFCHWKIRHQKDKIKI